MKYYDLKPPVQVGDSLITLLGVGQYDNGRIAVQLFSPMSEEDGGDGIAVEPFDTLSVNLSDEAYDETYRRNGLFYARNYSYHAPTQAAFVKAGYIEIVEGVTGDVGGHGRCNAAVLTPEAIANPVVQ